MPIVSVLCMPRPCINWSFQTTTEGSSEVELQILIMMPPNVRLALPVCLSILGGFYSDVVGHVGTSCMKCPNGSFVAYSKAPGIQAQVLSVR